MSISFDDLVSAVHASAPSVDSLDRLAVAATFAAAIADTADALLTHFVDQCRGEGRSWAEIGAALGVTKQAAQKRFVDHSLERLTTRARAVLDVAREIADDQGAAALRLDHLAQALFSGPETIAARVLTDLGITQAALDDAIAQRARTRGAKLSAEPPVDQTVLATALSLGHNYIGAEHFLLACHRDPRSLMARTLDDLGATAAKVRERVAAELATSTGGSATRA